MNARYFLPLAFGLSLVITFPKPSAPKAHVFRYGVCTYFCVGREPMRYQLCVRYGFSGKMLSSR